MVVGRPTVLKSGGRARVAAASPASADLAALLGLHLLGAKMEPVFGLAWPNSARSAFSQGVVDAVLLRGHGVPEQFAALSAVGAQPLFTFGALDEAGNVSRDPAYPAVPNFANSMQPASATTRATRCATHGAPPPRRPNWSSAWCCRSSHRRQWLRCGGAPAVIASSLGVQATAATVDVRPLGGPAATANTAAPRQPVRRHCRHCEAGSPAGSTGRPA